MALETYPWDAAECLDTPEIVAEYITAALEDGDPALIAAAIGNVARAKGIAATDLSRESLTLSTIVKVLHAFKVRLRVRTY
jgi:probable addiction module antidote protein